MTTGSLPNRLNLISDRERPDHFHLPADAQCYFWGEYTPYEHTDGKKWDYSKTNQLISNFKKHRNRIDQFDWQYKLRAIDQVADYFSRACDWKLLNDSYKVMLVPVPPSKSQSDPSYDGRMNDMLKALQARVKVKLDVRDCLRFDGSTEASHATDARPSPEQLQRSLQCNRSVARVKDQPGLIFIFDDMLTTGAHFVAATGALESHFPKVQKVGMFIARRAVPNGL